MTDVTTRILCCGQDLEPDHDTTFHRYRVRCPRCHADLVLTDERWDQLMAALDHAALPPGVTLDFLLAAVKRYWGK